MATVPKPSAPKSAAALKRAAAELTKRTRLAAEDAAQEARRVQFDVDRPVEWLRIWAKALRLTLLVADHFQFRENNSWWFNAFDVDVKNQTLSLESRQEKWAGPVCEANLEGTDVVAINSELDYALSWYTDYVEAQEAARMGEIERAGKRVIAMSKLTKEECKLLGLS